MRDYTIEHVRVTRSPILFRRDRLEISDLRVLDPETREFDPEKPEEIVYPVIVKPVDSCSSKGIRRSRYSSYSTPGASRRLIMTEPCRWQISLETC